MPRVERHRVWVLLEAMPDPDGVPPFRRLARGLKHLVRANRWRCRALQEDQPEQPRPSQPEATTDA